MESRAYFEALRVEIAGYSAEAGRILQIESSDRQLGFKRMMDFCYTTGCISYILGEDDEARRQFTDSVSYGVRMLDPRLLRERPLSIDKFIGASAYVIAFGNLATVERLCNIRDDEFTANPNVVPEAGTLNAFRARRAVLQGNDSAAVRFAELALQETTNKRVRIVLRGLLSIVSADEAAFVISLREAVKEHKATYKASPHLPEGAICLPGMILSRIALERGIQAEEGAYVPLRFVPNPS